MRNRLFLLSLLAILLLMQAVLRTAAQATPFSGGELWGCISFWELRGAIPLGVFAAGWLLASTTAPLLCLQAALTLRRGLPETGNPASRLISALLWCGVPAVVSCFNGIPYIFDCLTSPDSANWQTRQHLEWALHGGLILLIICHFLALTRRREAAWFILPVSLLAPTALGLIGCGNPLILFPGAIIAATGCILLGSGLRIQAILLLFLAAGINFILLWLHASPVADTPAAVVTYIITLLVLCLPLYLKYTMRRN